MAQGLSFLFGLRHDASKAGDKGGAAAADETAQEKLKKFLTPTKTALYDPQAGTLIEISRTRVSGDLGKQQKRARKASTEPPLGQRCVQRGAVTLGQARGQVVAKEAGQPLSSSPHPLDSLTVDADRPQDLPTSDALHVTAKATLPRAVAGSLHFLATPVQSLSLAAKAAWAREGSGANLQVGTDFDGANRVSAEGRWGDEERQGRCTACNVSADVFHGQPAYALSHAHRLARGASRVFARLFSEVGCGSSLVVQSEHLMSKGRMSLSPMLVVEREGGETRRWEASLVWRVSIGRQAAQVATLSPGARAPTTGQASASGGGGVAGPSGAQGSGAGAEAGGGARAGVGAGRDGVGTEGGGLKGVGPAQGVGAVRAMALRAFDGLLEGVSSAGGIVLRQPRRMSGGGPLGRERGNSGVAGLFEDRRGVRRDDSGGQRRRDGQRRKQSFSEHMAEMDDEGQDLPTLASLGARAQGRGPAVGGDEWGVRGILDSYGFRSLQVTVSIGDVRYRDLQPLYCSVAPQSF